jgi:N-acetylglutamate synthase-like GNAT family acetyltransferase
MIIRKAKYEDCTTLSGIAYKSKAHWGYSEEFLNQCKDDLTVTKKHIDENSVYVMEKDNKTIAFYCFSLHEKKLLALFIDPAYIGKGLGRVLWLDLLQQVKCLNIEEFILDSDPNAEVFYAKMGAQRIGEVQSTVFPDRYLPLMQVEVS